MSGPDNQIRVTGTNVATVMSLHPMLVVLAMVISCATVVGVVALIVGTGYFGQFKANEKGIDAIVKPGGTSAPLPVPPATAPLPPASK